MTTPLDKPNSLESKDILAYLEELEKNYLATLTLYRTLYGSYDLLVDMAASRYGVIHQINSKLKEVANEQHSR